MLRPPFPLLAPLEALPVVPISSTTRALVFPRIMVDIRLVWWRFRCWLSSRSLIRLWPADLVLLRLLLSRFKVLPWRPNPNSNVPYVLPLFLLRLYFSISLV